MNVMTRMNRLLAIAALILLLAAAAACGNADPQSGPLEPDPDSTGLRTAEVFDTEAYKDQLTVRYLFLEGDKSEGDSMLVTTPDGHTMLIDAGTPGGGRQVRQYLEKMNIGKLDVIVNTHPHVDHLGGFPTIIHNIEVGQAYSINFPYLTSSFYNDFRTALRMREVPLTYLEEGDSFQLGDEVRVEVYRPIKGELPDSIQAYDANSINQFSMVFKLIYQDTSFLFTGDIYRVKENEIADSIPELIKADVMHAPHHGWTTSSGAKFLSAVRPKIVAISNNVFNDIAMLNRYEAHGATPYATSLHGSFIIVSDGSELRVVTEKDWENPLRRR